MFGVMRKTENIRKRRLSSFFFEEGSRRPNFIWFSWIGNCYEREDKAIKIKKMQKMKEGINRLQMAPFDDLIRLKC